MFDFGAKDNKKGRRRINPEQELNLVPMLDLFLSLIPFLLASTVLINFGSLFVETPSYAVQQQQQGQPEQQKNKIVLDLAVDLVDGKISVVGYKKGFEVKLNDVKAEFPIKDVEKFRTYLISLEMKYGKINSSLFHASPNSLYEDAVLVINAIRTTESTNNLVLAVGAVQ